jgi:hypothetical protein
MKLLNKRGLYLFMGLLCAALVVLIFLSRHQITHGTVVEKKVHPEEEIVTYMPLQTGKTTTFYPVWTYYPESYSIGVQGRTIKGQLRTEEFYVEKDRFEQLYVGGEFSCGSQGEQRCDSDRPHQERK